MQRAPSVTLIMGDSGSGKSSLIGTLADYVWKKFGKVTLLYSADGGGYPSNVEVKINDGILWIWRIRTRGEALETISRAVEGWWPVRMANPLTGESEESCRLAPPVRAAHSLFCPSGHLVAVRGSRRDITLLPKTNCQTCGVPTHIRENGRVESKQEISPWFEKVGAVAYDSLTSMGEWTMTDLQQRRARGDLRGEETALGGKISSGDLAFGANNRSDYGFAQSRCQEWILKATTIPALSVPPVFTALEAKVADAQTKLPVYGPQIPGQAKVSEVPSWVGNCLGACVLSGDGTVSNRYRLYLTQYRLLEDNVPHLCKVRAYPGTMPDYLEDEDGKPFGRFNLGYFFDLLEESFEKAKEKTATDKPPGPPPSALPGEDSGDRPSNGQTGPLPETMTERPKSSPSASTAPRAIPATRPAPAIPPVGKK